MASLGNPTGISRTIKNIGSQATQPATARAQSTAIGSNRKIATATQSVRRHASERSRRSIHPGSAAGMNNESPAYLMPNGAGYDNPRHQQARFRKPPRMNQQIALRTEVIRGRKNIRLMKRGISASQQSSFSKMSKILDRN